MHSIAPHLTYLMYIFGLILLSHLLPGLPVALFSLWFSDQVLCVFHIIAEESEYLILLGFIIITFGVGPVPVAARSKALVCGRSPAEIVGSNPTGGMDVCLL